jgi:hypothetical protein
MLANNLYGKYRSVSGGEKYHTPSVTNNKAKAILGGLKGNKPY